MSVLFLTTLPTLRLVTRPTYNIIVFRKQNKFQIRKKAGIQSQENGHISKIKIKTSPMYLVKSFDFEGVKDKLILPNLQLWCLGNCNFASQLKNIRRGSHLGHFARPVPWFNGTETGYHSIININDNKNTTWSCSSNVDNALITRMDI